MQKTAGQVIRILRRSTALALAVCALWVTARTTNLPSATQKLRALSGDAAFAISLLSAQLPSRPERPGPTGWQRLVLSQSPAMCAVLSDIHAVSVTQEIPAPDAPEEDQSEPVLPPSPVDESDIIPKTMIPSPTQSYLRAGDIYIANRAQKQPDVAALSSASVRFTLTDGPQILILHSHGSEAYTPTSVDTYEESDPYRTTNCNYNVVRVGEEIARVFRESGFEVIHDTTLYDYPSYNEAYDRSLAAAQRWLSQHPSIQVVLDIHRDALAAEDGTIYKAVSPESDGQAAQVMLVVGTDGTKKHPLWQENLTFAMRIQQQLLDDHNTLARPMVLRASRYNQHLSVGSILVEIGTHGNTLPEALLGARLFAESTVNVLLPLKK